MEGCCLCREDLSDGPAKKKRKKLFGDTAVVSRKQLSACCLEVLGSDLIFDQNAYLCSTCDTLLCRLHKLNCAVAEKLLLLQPGMSTS